MMLQSPLAIGGRAISLHLDIPLHPSGSLWIPLDPSGSLCLSGPCAAKARHGRCAVRESGSELQGELGKGTRARCGASLRAHCRPL
eukprot:366503-Chlamydomonas_euryale.AAC.10